MTVTLSTRDWAKWNLEHPYQKKGRKKGAGKVSVSRPNTDQFKFGSKLDQDLVAGFHHEAEALPKGVVHTGKTPMTDAEYRQHRNHVEHEIVKHGSNDLLRSPFSTHVSQDRYQGVEGAYTPERKALHEQLLAELEKRAAAVPTERRAIVTGGIGGAGKSTILRTNAQHHDSVAGKLGIKYDAYDDKGNGIGEPTNFITLNPDEMKGEMQGRGMTPKIDRLSPAEAGVFIHEEASHLTDQLAQRMQAQGKNVIWDVTLNSVKSGNKRIDPLHAPSVMGGYHVAGAFVDVSTKQSQKNAEQRHRKGQDRFAAGNGLGGRYVPSELITGAKDPTGQYRTKNRVAFEELKPKFDQTLTIDNENYAGKLLDETGSRYRRPRVAKRAEGDPQTTDITDQIKAYRNGDITLADLVQSLGQRTYKRPDYYQQAHATEDDLESVDHFQPGTFGEVDQARNIGLLTADEYQQIHDAAMAHHRQRNDEGQLETRDWKKWNLEHPWIKKGRKHGDLSSHYRGRDLHAEGQWPIGHNPRYGVVIFDKHGNVLLREPKNHYLGYHWTFAKGGPDPGEAHVDVAHREAYEETGRVPRIVSHIPGGFKTPHVQEPYVDKYGNQHHADGSYHEAAWTDEKGVVHEAKDHPGYGSSSTNYFYLGEDTGAPPDYAKVIANNETSSVGYFTPEEARARISQGTIKGGVARDLAILDAAIKERERIKGGGTPTPPQPHNYPSAPEVKPPPPNPVAKPSPGEGHHSTPKPVWNVTKSPKKSKQPKLLAPMATDETWEQLIAKGKKKYGNRQWLTDMLNFRFDWMHGWKPVSPEAFAEVAAKAEKAAAKADLAHKAAADKANELAHAAQVAASAGDLHKAMNLAAEAHGYSIHADAKKEAEATTHAAEEAKLHEFASKAGTFGTKSEHLTPLTEHSPKGTAALAGSEFEKGAKSTGSNPGNWYTHKTSGDRYLAKQAKSPEHAYNEVASNEVFHQAEAQGLTPHTLTPNVTVLHNEAGTVTGVASHAVGDVQPVDTSNPAHLALLREGFGLDALTSNFDFAGDWPAGSNVGIKGGGTHVVRIDQGGAMAFRGSGVPKASFAPGKSWDGGKSLREGGQGKSFYGNMTDAEAAASLEAAAKVDLNQVAERWKAAGIPESVSAPWLTTLKERQAQIPAIVAKLKGEPKIAPVKVAEEFLPPTPKQAPHVVAEATVAVPAGAEPAHLADMPAYLKTGSTEHLTAFTMGHNAGTTDAWALAKKHQMEGGLSPAQVKVKVKARGSKLAAAAKKAKENGNLEAHANLFGQYKAHYAVANAIGKMEPKYKPLSEVMPKSSVPSGEAQKVEHAPPVGELELSTLMAKAEAAGVTPGLVEDKYWEAHGQNVGALSELAMSAGNVAAMHDEAQQHMATAHQLYEAGQTTAAAQHLGKSHAASQMAQSMESTMAQTEGAPSLTLAPPPSLADLMAKAKADGENASSIENQYQSAHGGALKEIAGDTESTKEDFQNTAAEHLAQVHANMTQHNFGTAAKHLGSAHAYQKAMGQPTSGSTPLGTGSITVSGPSVPREVVDLMSQAETKGTFSPAQVQKDYLEAKAQALSNAATLTPDAATVADLEDLAAQHQNNADQHIETGVKQASAAFSLGKSHGYTQAAAEMQAKLEGEPADVLHKIAAGKEVPSEPKVAEPTFHYEAPKVPEEHLAHGGEFLQAHEAAFKAGQEMHANGSTKQQVKAAGSNKGYKKVNKATTPAEKAQAAGTGAGYYAAAKQIPGPATTKKSTAQAATEAITPEATAAAANIGIHIPVGAIDYSQYPGAVTSSDPYVKGLPGIVQPVPGAWSPTPGVGGPEYAPVKIDQNLPAGWESLKADPAFELPTHDQTAYITAYKQAKADGAKATMEDLATKISAADSVYMQTPDGTEGESYAQGQMHGYMQAYETKAAATNMSAAEMAQQQTQAAFLTQFPGKYDNATTHIGDAGQIQALEVEQNPHGVTPAGATDEQKSNYNEHIGQGYDEAMFKMMTGEATPIDIVGQANAHISKAESLQATDPILASTHAGMAQGAKRAAIDFKEQNNFAKASSKSIIPALKVSPTEVHAIQGSQKAGEMGVTATSVSMQTHHQFNSQEKAGIKKFTKWYRSKDQVNLEAGTTQDMSVEQIAFVKELNDIWQQKSTGSEMNAGAVQARAFVNAVSTKAIPNKSQLQRKFYAQPGTDWYQTLMYRPDGTPKGVGDKMDTYVQSWSTDPASWHGNVWMVAKPGTKSLDIGSVSSVGSEIETVTGGRWVIDKIELIHGGAEHGGTTKIHVHQEEFYAR